jgi:2-dehydropantoate 2-reductase
MKTQADAAAQDRSSMTREAPPLRVAVLGAGALGSLYGGLLALAGCEVTLISTRPAHVEAIRTQGLTIETQDRELHITNLTAAATAREALQQGVKQPCLSREPADLLLVCVKSVATADAIAGATCLVGKNTVVLTLQNGLGNVETLCRAVPKSTVMAGVAYSGSTVLEPGRIREAGRGKTIMGDLDGSNSARAGLLCDCLNAAGLPSSISPNVQGLLWTKLMANVGINALAALTGLKNGELLEQPGIVSIMDAAVAEAMAVAHAKGIRLEVDAPQDYCRNVASNTAANYCSMVQDMQSKRRTEVESINGSIVAHGKELGIPTPINAMLTDLVLARQRSYLAL